MHLESIGWFLCDGYIGLGWVIRKFFKSFVFSRNTTKSWSKPFTPFTVPLKKLVGAPVINFILIEVPNKYIVVQHRSDNYIGRNVRAITFFK